LSLVRAGAPCAYGCWAGLGSVARFVLDERVRDRIV
jgi:hypothetical protein